jgi:RecA-family ATPase
MIGAPTVYDANVDFVAKLQAEEQGPASAAATPVTFNAAWLMQQVYPPTKYVVPGIVPEGMTLLVAAPKIGKSWMVLGLGLDLSSGGVAFGCLPVGKPRPVLYLALEAPEAQPSRVLSPPRVHDSDRLEQGDPSHP